MESEDIELVINDAETAMQKAISHLETELTKIRAGKANPTMLDGIFAEYYGNPTPINQIAFNLGKKKCFKLLNVLFYKPTLA